MDTTPQATPALATLTTWQGWALCTYTLAGEPRGDITSPVGAVYAFDSAIEAEATFASLTGIRA